MNEGNRQIDPASRHKETAILTTAWRALPDHDDNEPGVVGRSDRLPFLSLAAVAAVLVELNLHRRSRGRLPC